MKTLSTLTILGILTGSAYAEPPTKGTRGFMFRDPTAPFFRVVVCENMDLLKQIVGAQDHGAKFQEFYEKRNTANERLCFAIRFVGDVLDDPVPLGKVFFDTVTSNVWGVHVRFGNFEGYALYPEPIINKDNKPIITRAT